MNNSVVESPCVRNCCLDDNDVCLGCFRSVEEIVRWGEAGDEERWVILEKAEQRRALKSHFKRQF